MTDRPMTDRRHLVSDPPSHCWEVRGWMPPPGAADDREGWRTVAFTATHDDAVVVANALVAGGAHPYAYVEVWGPPEIDGGRSHVCDRFPEPSSAERREMWLQAASATYTADTRQ
ncbi:hypothetical protein LQ327_21715 [Actinomycetospora endophytica]|uniref:Uncharacterized protein n=1 Tax=Actinomycetospora endophytica TaxID=2291215 RepID=A0ABS8PCJ9_9PSEU|nr:hypothetical protein [Actinomycetospora endophytica]MCD2195992.1 hypothetical protein [Actinomycetospora endophytica]